MIELAWPGDGPGRKAVLGDWRQLPLAGASVAAAIGDGCFTMLSYPDEQPLLIEQLRFVIRPGGRAIIRCFATPEPGETVEAVCAAAIGEQIGFHAFKLRFNMAVAMETADGNVRSEALFDRFEAEFPDRNALSAQTGWSLAAIAEIDAYRGSRYRHCYPTRRQLLALVPGARFVETSGYPLAERCPLLVADMP